MKYLILKLWFVLGFLVFFTSCSKTKKLIENPINRIEMESPKNAIVLPFLVHKTNLNEFVNSKADSYFEANPNFSIEGIDLGIKRQGSIFIEVSGKTAMVKIPLHISISKNVFIGTVRAKGVIEVLASSDLNITNDWRLQTETEIVEYSWLEPLTLVSGISGFSVESIADNILTKRQTQIGRDIDNVIRENIDLPAFVQQGLNQIDPTFTIPFLNGALWEMDLDTISLSSISNQKEDLLFSIGVNGYLTQHKLNQFNPSPISNPTFNWLEENQLKESNIQLPISMSMDSLNILLRENLKDQVMESANQTIIIKDITAKVVDRELVTKIDLDGSYKGVLIATGTPFYDGEKNEISAKDLDLKFKSKNIFKAGIANLFKRKIKKELEENLRFSFDDEMQRFQNEIDHFLTDFYSENGVKVKMDINKIKLLDLLLVGQDIQSVIEINHDFDIEIQDINKLSNLTKTTIKN